LFFKPGVFDGTLDGRPDVRRVDPSDQSKVMTTPTAFDAKQSMRLLFRADAENLPTQCFIRLPVENSVAENQFSPVACVKSHPFYLTSPLSAPGSSTLYHPGISAS
jgi:hypothetical protein